MEPGQLTLLIRRVVTSLLILGIIILMGTAGFYTLTHHKATLIDCFYMTMITITTIGFGEIIDMHNNPTARLFTIFIAVCGIGAFTYIVSNITAFAVGSEVMKTFKVKRMKKLLRQLSNHYIICGTGEIGKQIADELLQTARPFVLVDKNEPADFGEEHTDTPFVKGDATDEGTLTEAGIGRAAGLFAVTGDDNYNLVITLTAKQLNPEIRVISKSREVKHFAKMKIAGADSVISPYLIGGLRMVSEMVRPAVVTFLDQMLRDREKSLRIEEVTVPEKLSNQTIGELDLGKKSRAVLLALLRNGDWVFNPAAEERVAAGNVLVFMMNSEDRAELERFFN